MAGNNNKMLIGNPWCMMCQVDRRNAELSRSMTFDAINRRNQEAIFGPKQIGPTLEPPASIIKTREPELYNPIIKTREPEYLLPIEPTPKLYEPPKTYRPLKTDSFISSTQEVTDQFTGFKRKKYSYEL